MRLDEKNPVPTSYGCFKTGAKTIIGLYLFKKKYKLVSLKHLHNHVRPFINRRESFI
jgi:hypothetical protein